MRTRTLLLAAALLAVGARLGFCTVRGGAAYSGVIDKRAQTEVLSALRTDTLTLVSLGECKAPVLSLNPG